MSISTEWEIKNIQKLAEAYKKEYETREKLSEIRDEIINLLCNMTPEDIKAAEKHYIKMLKREQKND